MVYAYYVNILGGGGGGVTYCKERKKKESWVVVSKEVGREVNADKTKQMVMSRDQNAGRSHNVKN